MAQDKPAYQLFKMSGKTLAYSKLLKKALKHEVVFFGELHNNFIAHWLELELIKDIFAARKQDLVIGLEMFETDNQTLLDDFLSDKISAETFEKEVRLWNNYKTDYKPILLFAKQNHIKVVATNVPRRYASTIFKEGIEKLNELPDNEKSYIAPLPFPFDIHLPAYQSMLKMMGEHSEPNENFPKAQAIKDATMAHCIAQNREKNQILVHINGAFHSDDHEGIVWYLKKHYQPSTTILTITTIVKENINMLDPEKQHKADVILCVPTSMPTSF